MTLQAIIVDDGDLAHQRGRDLPGERPLVNIDRIRRVEPGIGSGSIVVLEGGERLVVSRAYRRGRVKALSS